MGRIIGIDLGTTNSAVAVIEGGNPEIIENSEGARTTPSIVAVSKNGERLTGLLAKRQAVTNPENTIHGIKRFMGHRYDDKEIQESLKSLSYNVEKDDSGGVKVKMGDKQHRPEEISAQILQKLKTDAENKLGEKVTEAVITVPAYFDDSQRKATKDAGKIAGLEVKRIINEPTAAAMAYGFNKNKNEKIAVFDFGGGTFDISILEVSEDDEGNQSVEVKATDGDSSMGGEDIDNKIIEWMTDNFQKTEGIDISKDVLALQRLKEAAEKAKHELSTSTETEINIPFITSDSSGPKHLMMKMNRATLEELAEPYIKSAIDITKKTVESSKLDVKEIDEIILVGGQTRMPAIVEKVKEFFGKEPNRSINPDEVVALGAAVQAGVIGGDVKDILLLDVIPLSLGIETLGGVATKVLEKNTTIPASRSQTFSTAADNQTSVEVHIVQGERPMAADNKSLGRFILDGIPPAPRGVPQIEVSLDVDSNGILNVTAKDKTSGKEQSIRIEASSGLSEEEVKKMQDDAEVHAQEDEKKKEVVDVRNTAEMTIYTAEKALKDNEEKLSEDIKNSVNEKIEALRNVKDGEDIEAIKNGTQELSSEMTKIGESVQQQSSDQAQEGTEAQDQQTNQEEQEGNVRDVDFKETDKDEEKKEDDKKDDSEEENK